MLFIAAKYKELILETNDVQGIFSGLSLEGSDFECGVGITEDRKFPLCMGKIPYVSHGQRNKNMKLEKRCSSITSASRMLWTTLGSSSVQML